MRKLFLFLSLLVFSVLANATQVYSEGNGNNAASTGLGVCQLVYSGQYSPTFTSSPDGYGYAGACNITVNGSFHAGNSPVYVRDCVGANTVSQQAACSPPPAPVSCTDQASIKLGGCSCNSPGYAYTIRGSTDQICAFGRDGCRAGEHDDTSLGVNQCASDCKSGFVELSNGVCAPRMVCAPYEISQSDGSCKPAGPRPSDPISCPVGTHQSGTSCAPNNPPQVDPCPVGTHNVSPDASNPNCTSGAPPLTPAYSRSGEVTNPDGSKTQTTTSYQTIVNSDNSTTTTSTTTVTNISSSGVASAPMTTTESKTSPSSTSASAANNPDKPKDFCALHPELTSCKNSTVSGACATLQCNGDAVQCASLFEQQRMYCESQTQSSLVDLGSKMLRGDDASVLGSASMPKVVDLGGMTRLDASPFLGGGACFPDQVFPFYGRTVAIPWSRACEPLAGLRMVVMFLAYFSAYKMLSGVVIRET